MSDQEKYTVQFRQTLHRYAPVTDESFAELLTIARFRTVKRNEYLLSVGQVAINKYFVCRGILVSVYLTEDGGEHTKNFFTEGNFAGSTVSALQSAPSAFALRSLEEGVILEYDHRQYKQLINERADLARFYIAYLEQSWVIKNERRQIAFATQTATERYLTFFEEYPALESRVPLRHVASYLGITPTQLSRIRKELQIIE